MYEALHLTQRPEPSAQNPAPSTQPQPPSPPSYLRSSVTRKMSEANVYLPPIMISFRKNSEVGFPLPLPGVELIHNYYPFGMMMPGRRFENEGNRYGFQGQERDDEIKGPGNSLNYKYRMHDPRIGRFFALDPLAPEYPWNSPYAFSENRVIDGVELEGLEYRVTVYQAGMAVTPKVQVTRDESIKLGTIKTDYVYVISGNQTATTTLQKKIDGPVASVEAIVSLLFDISSDSGDPADVISRFESQTSTLPRRETGTDLVEVYKGSMSMTVEGQTFTATGTIQTKLARTNERIEIGAISILLPPGMDSEANELVDYFQTNYGYTPDIVYSEDASGITIMGNMEMAYDESIYSTRMIEYENVQYDSDTSTDDDP